MKSGRAFLLVFLLPILAVSVIAMLINAGAFYKLKQQHAAGVEVRKYQLDVLNSADEIGERMADIHRQVAEILKRAQDESLDESQIYRIHSRIVDRLAQMDQQVQTLSRAMAELNIKSDKTDALLAGFGKYSNYVIMATDMAAIDPKSAGQYIANARDQYFDFFYHAHGVATELGKRANESAEFEAVVFQKTFRDILVVLVLDFFAMLVLSFVVARTLSGRVTTLTDALGVLAREKDNPQEFPAVERIYEKEHGGFKELAEAVLSFRKALVDRHRSDKELLDYKLHLEELVENRTRELSHAKSIAENSFQYARSLIEASIDPLMMINAEGAITDVNSAAEKVTGVARDKLIGSQFSNYFTDPKLAQEGCQKAFAQGFVTDYPLSILHVSGSATEVIYNASVYRDAYGKVLGILSAARDITERRQVEQQLRIAATTFESHEGILVTDRHGIILRVNHAFTSITGYAADEICGQTPRILRSDRQNAAFYEEMWSSIDSGGGWQGEIWNRRKNGEIYPEYLTITAVKDPDGNISNYVAMFNDITASKAASEEIKSLAFYDPLTRLPNRRLLLDRLRLALVTGARSGSKGALLFIDLDNFKRLNDTLGHDFGDLLLQQVAERLTYCIREGDTVARLGGDEFVVMLEELSCSDIEAAAHAELIGQKILLALNKPYLLGMHEVHSTPSIGATLFGDLKESIEETLKRADMAMYHSKASGRNALRFFDPNMQAAINARAEMEAALRVALACDQFTLYYQPQVSCGGEISGAEALVRWMHPQRGIVLPNEFIPLAEETGLILPLGGWVLNTACAQLARWATQERMNRLTIAVNVSARQFQQEDFVERVLTAIERSGANPSLLKLELTESMLLASVDDVIVKMRILKSRGVGFSLDDFGTGYSSLAYLSRLPLDQLKIDRSFVREIESNDDAVVICVATISLAHSLKLQVVAEGVETEAQRYILNSVHRCDFSQGYLFSQPLSEEVFEHYVANAPVRL